jgi:hypothetical protein
MDISIIPALAGLTGAAIGGLTSRIASLFAQKTQARMQLLAQDKVRRQELYKEFIEAATQCYAAPQHEQPEIPALVNLYGKIGRMRVLSSTASFGDRKSVVRLVSWQNHTDTLCESSNPSSTDGGSFSWTKCRNSVFWVLITRPYSAALKMRQRTCFGRAVKTLLT